MIVSVIGAGKMGLPLACQFAARGATVYACDVNAELVDAINRGENPIDEPGVGELLSSAVSDGRLVATTDTVDAVRKSDVVVVITPAILTEGYHADLRILESVTEQIAQGLHDGLVVSYETTVPIGTTRSRFLPILEASGAKVGENFFLAYSPERVKSGFVLDRVTLNPKVVGGYDFESGWRAEEFYSKYQGSPVIRVGTLEEAEFIKIAGMLYRDVNIALSNELARYAESAGIDLVESIHPINTDGEARLLDPGIGVGGHCTPVYPYFIIHDAQARGVPVTLAEAARQINDTQPDHEVSRLEGLTGSLEGARCLILGLGFRPGVKEHIYSPAFQIRESLERRGADVFIHDELYTDDELGAHGFTPGRLERHERYDAVILNTAHPAYLELDPDFLTAMGVRAVLDGRNVWDRDSIAAAGVGYVGVGRP
jgi:nucleotide sugar dehydrogenase